MSKKNKSRGKVSAPKKEQEEVQKQVRDVLNDPNIPRIHFNGFVSQIGIGDVLFILQLNNQPVAVLNASYTIAKTLAHKLGELISGFENTTGNTIMTTDYIKDKIRDKKDETTH